ncbi:MAG: bifunctional oligoribonuclease/PAP phosphatase NrnA [Deltaproteobacteria bacterium]|nr:bifunctional oligoribonuclease/PAP phosphatase NrnA [Deltaproteobacteria bacterium]
MDNILAKLEQAIAGQPKILIVMHNNPDPDTIASAQGLKTLLTTKWRRKVVIAYSGIIARPENKAMVRSLKIGLVKLKTLNPAEWPFVAVVDGQPGAGNISLPEGATVGIVIDHHGRKRTCKGLPFVDIRPKYGSTSTIITEYLIKAKVKPTKKLATALYYGIKTDTQNLGRDVTEADIKSSMFLYPQLLFKTLAKIEHPTLPRGFFVSMNQAITDMVIYGDAVICDLRDLEYPDVVSVTADSFLQMENIRWTFSFGCFEDRLFLSIRTNQRRTSAGRVAQIITHHQGSAGGHATIAGGAVDVKGMTDVKREALKAKLTERFLRAIKRETCKAEQLVK